MTRGRQCKLTHFLGVLLLIIGSASLAGCDESETDAQSTPPEAMSPAESTLSSTSVDAPETPQPVTPTPQPISITVEPSEPLAASELLSLYCGACHTPTNNGGLSRISNMRKTPEGWDMSIVRMSIFHGVDVPVDIRRTLVKYLADAQGLAPSETQGHRAVLEQRHNIIETGFDEELNVMCARCHSNARYALQRRDTDEWNLLANMHAGQWQSIEYQALARDRNWWEIASTIVPEKLGSLYPLETTAWSDWRAMPREDLSGTWAVTGHWPGKGDYAGAMEIDADGDDAYHATYTLTTSSGDTLTGTTKAIVYTGYEWRGRGTWGDMPIREIFALSEEGTELTGRWHIEDSFEIGSDFSASRVDANAPHITSVWPAVVESGESVDVTIIGMNLEGDVSLGPDIKAQVTERSATKIIVRAKAKCSAASGLRNIEVGDASAQNALTLYEDVDYIQISPDYGIARVGGGMTPPVTAQFEAIGYTNGPDGIAQTEDDLSIGPLQAEWRVEAYDEVAQALEDVKYAGTLDDSGLFTPGDAGPNPERKYGTNNVGDLKIIASVPTYNGKAENAAHLIVTVQKWNNPPIQ